MGLREEILARPKPAPVRTPAADLGVEAVWLKVWEPEERIDFLDWHADAEEDTRRRRLEMHPRAFILSACDEAGARLFAEADLPALLARQLVAASRLGMLALKLNGLWEDDDSKS